MPPHCDNLETSLKGCNVVGRVQSSGKLFYKRTELAKVNPFNALTCTTSLTGRGLLSDTPTIFKVK